MDTETQKQVAELRQKIQRLEALLAERAPKIILVRLHPTLKWHPDRKAIMIWRGEEHLPLSELPTPDLLYAVQMLPAFIASFLRFEETLQRELPTALKNVDEYLRLLLTK